MELVVSDFLPALPRGQLRHALHAEACYVLQGVDVNTCYAAGVLLWRAADMLGCALQIAKAADAAVRCCSLDSRSCCVATLCTDGNSQCFRVYNSLTG
jgi:hypothetical protein